MQNYGTIDRDYGNTLATTAPGDDGPVWVINLMRYKDRAEYSDYTYARHVAWMQASIIDHLDVGDATFFGQDWGGLRGLRLVARWGPPPT